MTNRYERAIAVTAKADGSEMAINAPDARDRSRVFATRPATLPPGIETIDEPEGYIAGRDVLAGRLTLPSGRVAVDSYFTGETVPLALRARPGSYPVHVTLARGGRAAGDSVALATLVVSDARTVRWRRAGGVGVDGGTAAFSSAEGAAALGHLIDHADRWQQLMDDYTYALVAHDGVVANLDINARWNLVEFSTGWGDGGYPLYIGLDARGRPTRFVLDFYVLHLRWPGATSG